MGNISKIVELLKNTWKLLSDNAFLGALAASLISWLVIYYITEKIKTKNKIQALQKELATNEYLLRYGKEISIKNNSLERVHLHMDAFYQIINSNLQKQIGAETYGEIVRVYNDIKKHNQYISSIEMGLRSVKNLGVYMDEWILLAEQIKEVDGKIKI